MADTVVTGIAVASPNGLGTEDYWSATLKGANGIGPISRFDATGYPARLAGEVPGFDAESLLPSRLLPQTDHMTRMAIVLAGWSLADSRVDLSTIPELERGVGTASTSGGLEFGQRELEKLWGSGWSHVSAYMSFAWYYAVNTGQISILHGMRGPGGVVVTEQAGGLDALGYARRQIRAGRHLMISGGVDSALCPYGLVTQWAGRRLSTSDDPDRAFRPFDTTAAGHVMGEGGAILIVEDADRAQHRGAATYGQIAGYAATFDPTPETTNLRTAAELALADAGLAAGDVDVVFADATGVPDLDAVEATALTDLFGPRGVPVTAPKTMTGRLSSGGAPVDVAAALLSLRDGVIPPTINVDDPAYDIDLVRAEPRAATLRTALVLARGYGGFNSAVVLRTCNN